MRSIFLKALFLLSGLFLVAIAQAAPQSGTVIQISRKLRMSSQESTPPRDYYLDLGEQHGVKVGDVFTVYRELSVINELSGQNASLLRVPLGEVTVYLVGEQVSVGRITQSLSPNDLPVMNSTQIRVGDVASLKSNLPFKPQSP